MASTVSQPLREWIELPIADPSLLAIGPGLNPGQDPSYLGEGDFFLSFLKSLIVPKNPEITDEMDLKNPFGEEGLFEIAEPRELETENLISLLQGLWNKIEENPVLGRLFEGKLDLVDFTDPELSLTKVEIDFLTWLRDFSRKLVGFQNEQSGSTSTVLAKLDDFLKDMESEVKKEEPKIDLKRETKTAPLTTFEFTGPSAPTVLSRPETDFLILQEWTKGKVESAKMMETAPAPRANWVQAGVLFQIHQSIASGVENGTKWIRLQLVPESLGRVNISLELNDSHLTGRIWVENEAVKKIIETNFTQLKDSLATQEVKLESLQVSVGSGKPEERAANFKRGFHRAKIFFQGAAEGGQEAHEMESLPGLDTGRRLGYNTVEFIA